MDAVREQYVRAMEELQGIDHRVSELEDLIVVSRRMRPLVGPTS